MCTFFEIWDHLTSLLAVIAWPLIILIMFLLLKVPISEFIKNIKRIGYGDAAIETGSPTKQQDEDDTSAIGSLSKDTSNANVDKVSGMFSEETMEVFADFVKNETLLDSLTTAEEKQDVLFKYSKIIYLIMYFNRIYNDIFGSQLRLLQKLNSSANENLGTLRVYYDYAKSTFPSIYEDYSYESYMEYLLSFNLIVNENGAIKITWLGKDFLKYLIEIGRTFEKVY